MVALPCSFWRFGSLVLLFSLVMSVRPGGWLHASEWKTVKLAAADWVVQESTGRVFATDVENNEVVEFDSQKGEVRRFDVGERPQELIIKQNCLVVGCSGAGALTVIDLQTNQVLGSVKLNGKGPYALFASRAGDDSYAYCICNPGTAWWDGEVFQVNLKELKVRKRTRVQGWSQSHPMHVAMSYDGKWLVPDARGASSPSGADLMKLDAEACEFTQLFRHHDSFGEIKAQPFNRFWTLGPRLFSLDLTKEIRQFTGTNVAVHPQFNLVAGLLPDVVVLQKFSDASDIVRIQREQSSAAAPSQNEPPFDDTLQFDLKNNRLFLGTRSGGAWLDLATYKNQLEPIAIIDAPSALACVVGQSIRVPISIPNSQASSKPSLNLELTQKTVSEIRLEGNHLQWTPTAEHIGNQQVELELKNAHGDVLDQVSIAIRISLPKFELPFNGRTMRISPQGQFLVVWGPEPGQESRHPAHTGPDSLAVFDLKQRKMLVTKTIPQGLRDVEVDEKYVYLAPASGSLIYRTNHDLSDTKRQFISFEPQQLLKIGPEQLVINGSSIATKPEVIDVEKLKTVKTGDFPHNLGNNAIFSLGNIAYFHGKVLDRQTGKLLRLESVPSLPALIQSQNNLSRNGEGERVVYWGRHVYNNGLTNYKNASIAQRNEVLASDVSAKWPLALFIGQSSDGKQMNRTLQFCDLVDGTIVQEAVIAQVTQQPQTYDSYGPQKKLITHGNQILILLGKELLLTTVPESIASALPMPLHFAAQQPTELKVGAVEKVKLNVLGQTPETSFSLLSEPMGIEIDEKTGVLSIETMAIWHEFLSKIEQGQPMLGRANPQGNPLDSAANQQAYQEFTGKPLPKDQLATQLPISVVMRGADGQEDGLNLPLIVTGPWKDIQAIFDAQNAQREKNLAEMRLTQEEQQRQQKLREAQRLAEEQARQRKTPTDGGSDSKSVEDRISRLEASVRRLEAALDAVLNKLDKEKAK